MAADRPTSTRGLRAGFFVVVVLMTSGGAFSLLSARRAAQRIDRLVTLSLERERLIGLMRLDSALLIQAADDYINAATDEERKEADRAMDVILKEIQDTSQSYSANLPRNEGKPAVAEEEAKLWTRLSAVAEKLVKKVDVTVKASNRKEAERARQHLEEEAKPISFELDDVAKTLGEKNAVDTKALLGELQDVRLRTSAVGALAVGLALLLSTIVAWRVTVTLRRQEATIVEQVSELNRRNAELDAFASRVAHDLVAPLAPLKGYLTLARRQVPDANVKDLLAQAESSTGRMSELVEGLLRFCRAGKSTDKSSGELDTAVTTILLEQGQAATASGVNLERSIDSKVAVSCPPQLLQSVAQNILSNAVKYAAGRTDARVRVSVRREKEDGLFVVSDNGPGMSPESLKSVFQPFFRAPETRTVPGTGLGLATTKRLVEAHGGTIALESSVGVGTTVTIRLPLVREAAAPPMVPQLGARS